MQLEIKKVDIICPVYNKSQVVVDFIYSFVNNLDSEYFNLIIINDGSTDDSLSIIS
ncbi:TPA: glycosyltransferase, partial [Raoultella ornithinolytica]